jgi:hypothetical protein
VKASLLTVTLLLLFVGVIYGFYRLIKSKLQFTRQRGTP